MTPRVTEAQEQPSDALTNNNNDTVDKTSMDDMPRNPGMFLHKDAKFSKLFPGTKEDNYHIHKTLGFLSLCSFIYRYFYVFPTTGTLGFDGQTSPRAAFDWATMIVHTMLAFSSILFRVPKKRILNKPMVIYEEYRQHAMVFTARCMTVFSLVYLFPSAPSYVVPLAVMLHHLMADRITNIWGSVNHTAVRATAARGDTSKDNYRHLAKLFSLYQFFAIASHILPNARLADLGYNALIAIQSSAFMMTLYRKRIVRGRTHLAVYSICLLLSTIVIIKTIGLGMSLLTVMIFLVRVNLPRNISNKYVIWALFLLLAFNLTDILVFLSNSFGFSSFSAWLSEFSSSSSHLFSTFLPSSSSSLLDASSLEMPATKGAGLAVLFYGAFMGERWLLSKEKSA